MRIGQTSVIYFLSKLVGSVLGFFATIYFARVLGETVLGQYALALTVVGWLAIGGQVGFSGAITKRVSEGNEPDRFIGAGFIVMSILSGIVILVVLIFRSSINNYVGQDVHLLILLLILILLYKSVVFSSLKGSHLVHIYALLASGFQVIQAIIQILLVAIFGLGLMGMLWGYASAYVIVATIGFWILGMRPSLPNREHIISLYEYAKYSWLGNIRGKTFSSVDIAVLGFFTTQGLIGIYSVAWSLSKFLDIFGNAISSTLFPEMSRVSSDQDADATAGLVEDALSYAGLILVPGLIGAYVIGDRLMRIYGPSFVSGTEVLAILILALLIYTYTMQLLNTLNAIDRPDLAFRTNAVFVISNLSMNIVLIWQFGWVGAAIATAMSAAVGLILAVYYTRDLVPYSIPYLEIARQWIAALVMGGIVFAAREIGEVNLTWINDYNAVFVVMLVGLGAAVYFAVLFGISSRFRTTVKNNLPFDIPVLT